MVSIRLELNDRNCLVSPLITIFSFSCLFGPSCLSSSHWFFIYIYYITLRMCSMVEHYFLKKCGYSSLRPLSALPHFPFGHLPQEGCVNLDLSTPCFGWLHCVAVVVGPVSCWLWGGGLKGSTLRLVDIYCFKFVNISSINLKFFRWSLYVHHCFSKPLTPQTTRNDSPQYWDSSQTSFLALEAQ